MTYVKSVMYEIAAELGKPDRSMDPFIKMYFFCRTTNSSFFKIAINKSLSTQKANDFQIRRELD